MKHKECVNMHYIAKVTHFITVIPEHFQFLPQVESFLIKLNSSYVSKFHLDFVLSFENIWLFWPTLPWKYVFFLELDILGQAENAYCKPLSSLF